MPTTATTTAKLIIDNDLVDGEDGTRPVIGPASEQEVGTYACASAAQVEAAIAGAQRAFHDWKRQTAWKREQIIRAATAHVRSKADEIGYLMALEQGKPLKQSVGEIGAACDIIDYYAAEGVRIEGTINPTEKPEFRSYITKQPVGVVAAITPWNYPVALLGWKLGPALAAGCSVVVKPTPVTPLSPGAFCAALVAGGLPPGLVQFLGGADDVALAQGLITDQRIAKVAMTGSTATGRKIMEAVAGQLKHVTLELGGHCPAIVCADADIPATAKAIVYKAIRNMGQSCSAMNRIYAHASIHDELVAETVKQAEAMTIGDGIEPGDVDLGPMCTAEARAKVEAHVADAQAHGATIHCGGARPADREQGYYYLPTVLSGMTPDMLMMREETFGPVAPFVSFDDIDDAIRQANDTEYGLVSYLFTKDMATTIRVSEALEAGTVAVNNVAVNTPYAPYEGWGASGYGVELGRCAIDEYLKRKHIKIAI